jgi:serine/threonine protein kinase
MLVGETPFTDRNENRMYQIICHREFSFPLGVDQVTQDLIRGPLEVDAAKRLGWAAKGAEEIKAHPRVYGIELGKVSDPKSANNDSLLTEEISDVRHCCWRINTGRSTRT